jgi:hypothetical protein
VSCRTHRAAALLLLASCGGAEAPSVTELSFSSVASAAPAPSGPKPGPSSSAAPPELAFALGCEAKPPRPLPERVILSDSRGAEKWIWACRAVGALGTPELRASGYPDFRVRDGASGACMTLSLEDVGAFVYHAPRERGVALRRYLEDGGRVPDCAFDIDLDRAVPRRVGVRQGQPFEEVLYDLSTVDGAKKFFEEHPHERSAGQLLNVYLEVAPKDRPKGLEPVLDRAASLELDVIGRMATAWLSPIGKEGYCVRTKQLLTLPLSAEVKKAAAAEKARFCP